MRLGIKLQQTLTSDCVQYALYIDDIWTYMLGTPITNAWCVHD